MRNYKLGFIADEVIFKHVKETVKLYTTSIDLNKFNHTLIDPIKLTFDAKVYGKSFEQIIESECIRQIDKSNTNHIGYFHQNLFKLIGRGWSVPRTGFDIVNQKKRIYVELKNKHNTMNASSAQATYMAMQNQLLQDPQSTCFLVEVIAKKSQNIKWEGSFRGKFLSHERIRRVSIDKFYELVFNDKYAFKKLCMALPLILDDVIKEEANYGTIENSVYSELSDLSVDTLKSLYMLAFKTYEGFDNI